MMRRTLVAVWPARSKGRPPACPKRRTTPPPEAEQEGGREHGQPGTARPHDGRGLRACLSLRLLTSRNAASSSGARGWWWNSGTASSTTDGEPWVQDKQAAADMCIMGRLSACLIRRSPARPSAPPNALLLTINSVSPWVRAAAPAPEHVGASPRAEAPSAPPWAPGSSHREPYRFDCSSSAA